MTATDKIAKTEQYIRDCRAERDRSTTIADRMGCTKAIESAYRYIKELRAEATTGITV